MKKFVLLFALVAILAVIAGCAAPTAAPAPASSSSSAAASSSAAPAATKPASSAASSAAAATGTIKGTLTLWHGYHTGGTEEKALNQLLDGIKKANPDLKLTVLAVPFDQLFNKYETEAAAGGGPDLWTAPNDNLGNEVRANLLKPLDDLLKGKLDKYSKLSVDGVTVDGKMYAVPMIVKAVALYYNKTKVPTAPKTTDDLMALVKSGKTIVINQNNYHNYGFFPAFGGTLMDAKGACVADQNTGFADAMQYLLDLKKAGAKFETDGGKADTMFRQGQVDMIINGPWVLGDYKGDLKDNLGVVPMPAGPKGPSLPLSGIDGWYVNANTKNADAAVALGLALTTPEAQKLYADLAGDPAVRTDVSVADPLVKAFADAGAAGFPRPQSAAFGNWWGPFGDMVTKVIEGKATPKDGVTQACADMNKANKITVAPASSASSSAAASSSASSSAASSAATGKPLKIGLLTDQTGALAIYGPMLENGFTLGLQYATDGSNAVAGRPIQVIVKDTASKVDVGTQVARDLIEKENVDILVGVPSSGVALAVNELAKQYKKIYIANPAAGTEVTGKNFNPYVFRTSRSNEQDALASGAALLKLGKTFVQIAPDYAFGYGSATGFYNVVKAGGGKFTVNDSADKAGAIYIPQDAKDFTPYLQKVLDAKADVLIVTWAGAGFVPLFQQMQQLGVFKAMTVYTGVGDNQTLKAGYADAVGVKGINVYHYTLPKNPINDWLVTNHIAKFKTPPDLFTEGGFTAAQMLVAGLKATSGDPDPDKLIKAYENNFSFDGPKGKYSVRPYDHVMLQTLYVAEITNVTDPDFKFVKLAAEIKPDDFSPSCTLEGDYASRCPKK